jgi:Ras homolog gene family, member A
VGTKIDLKDDDKFMSELKKNGESAIGLHEAQDMKKKTGADKYMECSAKTREGVNVFIFFLKTKELFDEAVRLSLYANKRGKSSTDVGKLCSLL